MIKRLIGKLKTLRLYFVMCSVNRKKKKFREWKNMTNNGRIRIGDF
jgi:hypothetical protein